MGLETKNKIDRRLVLNVSECKTVMARAPVGGSLSWNPNPSFLQWSLAHLARGFGGGVAEGACVAKRPSVALHLRVEASISVAILQD